MIPVHREHTVEIKKLKFESGNGVKHSHTALVHFYVNDKEKPLLELMGHMEEKEMSLALKAPGFVKGMSVLRQHALKQKYPAFIIPISLKVI